MRNVGRAICPVTGPTPLGKRDAFSRVEFLEPPTPRGQAPGQRQSRTIPAAGPPCPALQVATGRPTAVPAKWHLGHKEQWRGQGTLAHCSWARAAAVGHPGLL